MAAANAALVGPNRVAARAGFCSAGARPAVWTAVASVVRPLPLMAAHRVFEVPLVTLVVLGGGGAAHTHNTHTQESLPVSAWTVSS